MYKQYLKVMDSKNGKGIYSLIQIPALTPIMEANGPVYVEDKLPSPNDPALLQIGPNVFMARSGHMLPEYINHSCDPNCYFKVVGNRAILYSLYVIPVNAELTFDYSTTSTDTKEKWQMTCNCGSFKCRQVISGFQYLSPELQSIYKSKEMIPLYITSSILQKA